MQRSASTMHDAVRRREGGPDRAHLDARRVLALVAELGDEERPQHVAVVLRRLLRLALEADVLHHHVAVRASPCSARPRCGSRRARQARRSRPCRPRRSGCSRCTCRSRCPCRRGDRRRTYAGPWPARVCPAAPGVVAVSAATAARCRRSASRSARREEQDERPSRTLACSSRPLRQVRVVALPAQVAARRAWRGRRAALRPAPWPARCPAPWHVAAELARRRLRRHARSAAICDALGAPRGRSCTRAARGSRPTSCARSARGRPQHAFGTVGRNRIVRIVAGRCTP